VHVTLTVVGCSGSAPGPGGACSCYLIEAGGFRLLLDIGNGASGPLQCHAAPAGIGAVILSHAHADHYVDIAQLQYLRNVAGAPPLRIIVPSDLPRLVTPHPEDWDIVQARPGPVTLGPLTARLARVEHGTMDCWATRIGDELCYTSDTAPCPALDDLAAGCRVLLAEASGVAADGPVPRHLTAADAASLAARSGARLLILTHLRPWQDHGRLLAEAAAIAPCPVILAHSGLRVALS
jgi:ribonuclease BN (tRNA processing enzyme)